MNLLLDTHAIIWLMNKHEKLSSATKAMLLDGTHKLYVSHVSVWEVAIKSSIGKLPEFHGGVNAFLAKLEDMPIVLLPVALRHVTMVETLPFHHRDPFDRLLVAATKVESMTILTADENVRKYDVPWVW
jgi:PIN domain nuclease of toxin-antitoxin system